jgi:hypothetical protein
MPDQGDQSLCLHCREVIVYDTAWNAGYREPDYDANDSVCWRHLGGYNACMATRRATPAPPIVVLCGSTRFKDEFTEANRIFGLGGEIVLSVSMFGHSGDLSPEEVEDGHPTKTALDELHKRKIDLADRVFVVNPGGYIGNSTRSEIDYATEKGKPITYMEPVE